MNSNRKGKQIVRVEANQICPLCFLDDHSAMQCPWMYSKCPQRGCTGMKLLLGAEPGKSRYLRCQFDNCREEAQWLEDAIKSKDD